MDTSKVGIGRGCGISIGGEGHYRSNIFYYNRSTNITSTDRDKKGIKFSPQTQCNQLISYANLRDAFICHIQQSYVQGRARCYQ